MERRSPDEPKKWICEGSLYKYIYAFPRGELRKLFTSFLKTEKKLRKDLSDVHSEREAIPDAIPISHRHKEVENTEVPGHWEGDLIIGKNFKSALGTLVERTTRYIILVPIPGKKGAKSIKEAFTEVLQGIDPSIRLSIACDREMAEHKILTEETGVNVYFADPSSPWQIGTNETTNSLIRQYFPEKKDFSKVSLEEIKFVQNKLNERPRKVISFDCPKNAFKNLVGKI